MSDDDLMLIADAYKRGRLCYEVERTETGIVYKWALTPKPRHGLPIAPPPSEAGNE